MRILSFDSSTPNLYACLSDGETIAAEQILICNPLDRQFAASLIMPTVIALLDKSGWQKQDLDAIVVGIGPGSFTGARVAVVTARTLCQGLNLPLLGISRFQCYAFNEQLRGFPIAMVLQAGKKQYYCAHIKGDITSLASASTMDTFHLPEDQLLDNLQGLNNVYIEKSAPIFSEIKLADVTSAWHLLPDMVNPAIIQAQLAFNKLSKQPLSLSQLSYKQVKPLYIQNASVTVKAKQSVN